MKVFKSDGRYKNYDKGLHYICELNWHRDAALFTQLVKAFEAIHGPHLLIDKTATGVPYRKYNEHYRLEQNRKIRRRRIYMKEEHYITMVMLTMEQS